MEVRRSGLWAPGIIEGFFLKKIYENFVRTLETVLNIEVQIRIREVSVTKGSTVCLSTIGFYRNVNMHITITLHLLNVTR